MTDRKWRDITRPGYFGRRRDAIHARYNVEYGYNNWRIVWIVPGYEDSPRLVLEFEQACKVIYEESYFRYLRDRPDDVDFICEFVDCIDNAVTNVNSGFDYTIQESYATHIQDTAVRNVLRRLGRKFTGKREELLIIRSQDSNGYRFGPGNVPLYNPDLILRPSRCPSWANPGSTEAFWQSNKVLQVRV